MGNKPAERKRKKKGRPSLLDLQKRTLRLQKQQQEELEKNQAKRNPNPNPNPNPNLRSPHHATARNPNAAGAASSSDDDDSCDGKRREKKLKLVHRIPNSTSESNCGDRHKGERNNSAKGTEGLRGEPSDSGPTTPLPDKKLLEFILDGLQKKDTYSVFAEPVDPEELPDYHEIVDHPMDFATVRNKLSSGAYKILEQFEADVLLISSNAMKYNSSDTIYYRQARAIQELAKKNFENLRQESDDDDEPEPKTAVRRGRPPNKNIKRPIGRPPLNRTASDFSSSATLANAGDGTNWSNMNHDLSRNGVTPDRAGLGPVSVESSYNLRQTEPFSWANMHKSESNEEYSGYGLKGNFSKYGKKISVVDENRRSTYSQPQAFTFVHEPSMLTAFNGERKQLVPLGLHTEHAYARSLARFAANLGPVGRAIAAKKIERGLPPGTKFGCGWLGDNEAPRLQPSQPPLLSASPPRSFPIEPNVSTCKTIVQGSNLPPKLESPPDCLGAKVGQSREAHLPPFTSMMSNRSGTVDVGTEPSKGPNNEGGSKVLLGGDSGGASDIPSKVPFQFQQNVGIQPVANGFTAFGFNVPSQLGKVVRPIRPSGHFFPDAKLTHSRAIDVVSRNSIGNNGSICHQLPKCHPDADKANLVGSSVAATGYPLPAPGHNQNHEVAWQSLSQQMKQDSVPPDLNVRFQTPGSPASGVMIDTQQPDLALQL